MNKKKKRNKLKSGMAEEEKKRKDRKRETWLVAWGRKFNIGAKREKKC